MGSSLQNARQNVIVDPAPPAASSDSYVTPTHTPSEPVIADPTWINKGPNYTTTGS